MRIYALVVTMMLTLFAIADESPLARDSLYQLDIQMQAQNGFNGMLRDFRGQPLLVSMFYGSCTYVCPMIIQNLKAYEKRMSNEEQSRYKVLMVSLDAKHDTPESLKGVAKEHKLDGKRWYLAHVSETDVRKMAGLLGIKYRLFPDGSIEHSTVITLLDAEGRIQTRSTQVSSVDNTFLNAIHQQLQTR